jgi:hypothetical protein
MKRIAVILAILGVATLATAQGSGTPATGNAGQPAQPTGQSAPAGQTAPAAKRPPQAKTQPEFDAWKAASANTDPAALEKAADDFATKFPDS